MGHAPIHTHLFMGETAAESAVSSAGLSCDADFFFPFLTIVRRFALLLL